MSHGTASGLRHPGAAPASAFAVAAVTVREKWLSLIGESWAMSFDAAWPVTDGEGLVFGWSTPNVTETAQQLLGMPLVDIQVEGDLVEALLFANGWQLDVFQDIESGAQSLSCHYPLPGSSLGSSTLQDN
jgi:hypothetical protein